MATISQPRQSLSTTPSTRTSLDTAPSASAPNASPLPSRSPSLVPLVASPSTTGPPTGLQPPTNPAASRRNRAALRDYYGLKKPPADTSGERGGSETDSQHEPAESELDTAGFKADAYVANLLAKEGLDSLLRTESGLVNEVKFLASERAALVYDNYSKLITATDTIKRMRTNMAPLTPATSTLSPAVAYIADTARQLAAKAGDSPASGRGAAPSQEQESSRRTKDRDTVWWVLDTPRRIRELGPEKAEWPKAKELLQSWDAVVGVEKLRGDCEQAIEEAKAM